MTARNHGHQPVSLKNANDYARVRDVLAGADFTDRGVVGLLGVESARALSGCDVAQLLRRTNQATPLDTLIRLFLIGAPVEVGAARRAIAPMTLDDWIEAGLLQIRGTSVVAPLELLPFQGLVLAFDHPRRIEKGLSRNYVMGIGSSTLTLANLTVRRASSRTLDLGTGCGFLAFLAAPHSDRVLAVDRNPRAVHLAEFNARLNDLANVESREGDLFEPVEGEKFDLVVSNPPFVISPERRYIYRDSGMHGDQVSRTIVRQVPSFLNEGGYCQILCNWAHVKGQDWKDRLAEWFGDTGCDAWVMRSDTLESDAYAAKWIRHTERDDPDRFDRRFAEWVAYYDRERIEAISGGLITMRRVSGRANWFRADDGPEKMLGPAGEFVARGFELRDFLEQTRDDATLLGARLRVSPDARFEQCMKPCPEGWQVIESELRLARGLAYSGHVDPYMARMIARCDGRHPLDELVDGLASDVGKDKGEITSACLEIVRRLIEQGFLLPGEEAS